MAPSATKVERAPGSLAAQTGPMGPLPYPSRVDEDRLLMVLVGVSLVAHIIVIAASGMQFCRRSPPLIEDTVMDADLVTEPTQDGPAKTLVPDSKPAPEPKLARELLPQLPKQFSIKEATKPEESVAEEKEEAKETPPEAKPAALEQKADKAKVDKEIKDNQVNMLEALKRRALDRIRAEHKVAKEVQAPDKDKKLVQVAENLFGDKKNRASGVIGGRGRLNGYDLLLRKAVQPHYHLPEVYNLRSATLEVFFTITLGERGQLLDLVQTKSSGDQVFDEFTKDAITSAAPFPPPPRELVGKAITVRFTP